MPYDDGRNHLGKGRCVNPYTGRTDRQTLIRDLSVRTGPTAVVFLQA